MKKLKESPEKTRKTLILGGHHQSHWFHGYEVGPKQLNF